MHGCGVNWRGHRVVLLVGGYMYLMMRGKQRDRGISTYHIRNVDLYLSFKGAGDTALIRGISFTATWCSVIALGFKL